MILEKISRLNTRITAACQRAGRGVEEITIVAVSKLAFAADVKQAAEAGIINIGENKVQDALIKRNLLQTAGYKLQGIKWHMVGHLQTNKVKEALGIFDLIHSVDSEKIAVEIDKQAAKINKIQDVLVEVNVSQEKTKFGLKPEETLSVIKKISGLKNISIKGLMTIAPLVDNPEKARPFFRRLRELQEDINKLQATNYKLKTLSMGMTDDFGVAIEEGATIVRIGRAIFGDTDYRR